MEKNNNNLQFISQNELQTQLDKLKLDIEKYKDDATKILKKLELSVKSYMEIEAELNNRINASK